MSEGGVRSTLSRRLRSSPDTSRSSTPQQESSPDLRWERGKSDTAGRWQSGEGVLQLSSSEVFSLTEVERVFLRKVALARLKRDKFLADKIVTDKVTQKPLEASKSPQNGPGLFERFTRQRKRPPPAPVTQSSKRGEDDENRNSKAKVFAVPIGRCLANDILSRRKRAVMKERRESKINVSPMGVKAVSSASFTEEAAADDMDSGFSETILPNRRFMATSFKSKSRVRHDSTNENSEKYPLKPQIPLVILQCCDFLQTRGLHSEGIFRMGSAKRRIKELRESFDSGADVNLNQSAYSVYDVANLLKEYFRDLPEPLIPRYLYHAFIATTIFGCSSELQTNSLRCLCCLLPSTHRDTLWFLLGFLRLVADHAESQIDESGEKQSGNRMTVHNLATLFGPNILRLADMRDNTFVVEDVSRAAERLQVIEVTESLITLNERLFEVPCELLDEIYALLSLTKPDMAAKLIQRRGGEPTKHVYHPLHPTHYQKHRGPWTPEPTVLQEKRARAKTMETGMMTPPLSLERMTVFTRSENQLVDTGRLPRGLSGYPILISYKMSYAASVQIPQDMLCCQLPELRRSREAIGKADAAKS